MPRKKSSNRRPSRSKREKVDLGLDLSWLPAQEERDTANSLNRVVEYSLSRGHIPFQLVPVAADYVEARINEYREGSALALSAPEAIQRALDGRGVSRSSVFVPPLEESALISLTTGSFLAGGSGDIVFQRGPGDGAVSEQRQTEPPADFGQFLDENWEVLAEELLIEFVLLTFHLIPGLRHARRAAEKGAQKALRNRRVRDALRELIEDLMNYQWRGRGLRKLRRNLKKLIEELYEVDLYNEVFEELMDLSGWDILQILLDLLLAFTPVGWAKHVALILAQVGAIVLQIYHKYHIWERRRSD